MSNFQDKTLLLNQGYQPLKIITWQKAICLLFLEKADNLEVYCDKLVSSISNKFSMPAVIRLRDSIRINSFKVKFTRSNLFNRDNNECQYCGKEFSDRELTMDHVTPRSKGGKTDWSNIVSACKHCNKYKKDMTLEEAGMSLLSIPKIPNSRILFSKNRNVPEEWKNWVLSK